MGTLLTIGTRARVKIRDKNEWAFTNAELMGIVNDILENIYQTLVYISSNLVYGEGNITTTADTMEYTPSFSHNGFLREGVWIDGEDTYLVQLSEADKIKYDYDSTRNVGYPTNGDFEDWTGSDPDNWTKSANAVTAEETTDPYAGDSSLKLTATGAASQSVRSDAIAVVADKQHYLELRYKNTNGDVAQYAIYDITNSAWITSATDLSNSLTWSAKQSLSFTTPSGCVSIYIYLYAKSDGDIVWFDNVDITTLASTSTPEAYYITEDGKVGYLPVPDDSYTIHHLYWKPITVMSDYNSDSLPWGGIFNQYIEKMLIVECLEVLEKNSSNQMALANMEWNKALNMVYTRGLRKEKQVSDMFSVEGI